MFFFSKNIGSCNLQCKAAQHVYHSRAYSIGWECFRESGMIRLVKSPGMELVGADCKANV